LKGNDCIPGLVTVILPSFNHEAFVEEAMRSVYDQTYEDLEFLIVDDCSTDSTFSIISKLINTRRYTRRFRRLEVVRNQRNQGAHRSLNVGLSAARGQFVTFINSDDAYEPNRLCLLTSRCPNASAPFLAFTAVRLIDAAGKYIRRHQLKDVFGSGPGRFADALPSMSFAFLRHQLAGSTGNIFVNRPLLEEVGNFCSLKYCHDWDFMLRAVAVVEPCYEQRTTYRYRIHSTNSFRSLQHVAHEEAAAVLSRYYKLVANGRVKNSMAPTPYNWPYVFEMIARQFQVYEAWLSEAAYSPRFAKRQSNLLGDVAQPAEERYEP
jgi:glycosyltransferase involved in cell wall biosynthesis